eukprot:7637-Heterococcus_DN1.PRE.1
MLYFSLCYAITANSTHCIQQLLTAACSPRVCEAAISAIDTLILLAEYIDLTGIRATRESENDDEAQSYTSARMSTLAARSSVEGALARRRQLASQAARRVTGANGRTTVENSASSDGSSSTKRKRTDVHSDTIAATAIAADTSASVSNEGDEIVVVVAPHTLEALQYVATAVLVLPTAAALICCEERSYVLRGMQLLMKLTMVHANREPLVHAPDQLLQRLVELLYVPIEGDCALIVKHVREAQQPIVQYEHDAAIDTE